MAVPILQSKKGLIDFQQPNVRVTFMPPRFSEIPASYRQSLESVKYENPDKDNLIAAILASPFFKKDYYKVDLMRVAEYEELVPEWYYLEEQLHDREQTLVKHGFGDLLQE